MQRMFHEKLLQTYHSNSSTTGITKDNSHYLPNKQTQAVNQTDKEMRQKRIFHNLFRVNSMQQLACTLGNYDVQAYMWKRDSHF